MTTGAESLLASPLCTCYEAGRNPECFEHGSFAGAQPTLYRLRQRLAGWHFAQESLTRGEREILHVAEQILREYDALVRG